MRILRKYLCVDMWDGDRESPWKEKQWNLLLQSSLSNTFNEFQKNAYHQGGKWADSTPRASDFLASFSPGLPWIMSWPEYELDWRGEGRAAIATSLDYFLVFSRCVPEYSRKERGIKKSLEVRNWMVLSVIEVSRDLSYTVPGPFLPTGYLGHTLVWPK